MLNIQDQFETTVLRMNNVRRLPILKAGDWFLGSEITEDIHYPLPQLVEEDQLSEICSLPTGIIFSDNELSSVVDRDKSTYRL